MNFDWADLLEFTTLIESTPESPGPSEAALRAAISRAYYAALHLCRGVASQEGWMASHLESIHQAVPKYFRHSQPGNKARRRMAHELDLLRVMRVEADYEDTLRSRPEFLASKAVGLAKSIVAKLDSSRSSTVSV